MIKTGTVTIDFINPMFAIPCRDPEDPEYSKRLLLHIGSDNPGELSYGYYSFDDDDFIQEETGRRFKGAPVTGWAYA